MAPSMNYWGDTALEAVRPIIFRVRVRVRVEGGETDQGWG